MTRRCFLSVATALVLTLPSRAETSASVLQPYVDRHELAGAVVLVANKDNVLEITSVGFSDIEAGKPMTADTVFWIASQTKPMTATALMMLVDEGKLALDDPVEKHLPEFKGQMVIAEKDASHVLLRKPVHPITVREVLSHMSGLPYKSAIEEPTLDGLPLAAAVRSYAAAPLQTEPGTHYQYSNAGVNTAARIIEVISGMKYEDFMQKRLFDPLGMKDTTFWPTEEQAKRVAKSYGPNAEKTGLKELQISQLLYPLSDRTHRFPMPAGGLFSTANDVARFCQMLLNCGQLDGHRYVSEASAKEMSRRQTPETVKESYGLGFSLTESSFGHGGAQATNMQIFPAKGLVLVWMVQHSGFPGDGGKSQEAFRQQTLIKFARP
jgi:CubicO group peptidase (beta-lactamase class C family)